MLSFLLNWSIFHSTCLFIEYKEPIRCLSHNKPALLSSLLNYTHPDTGEFIVRSASLAFDGNLGQSPDVCTHSVMESMPWIRVDLLHRYKILSVKIFNRNDWQGKARLKNAEIFVSNDNNFRESNKMLCTKFEKITTVDQIQEFLCACSTFGRFVQLQIYNSYINICEMQVYGF